MGRPIGVRVLCANSIVREGLSRILADNEFCVSLCSTVDEVFIRSKYDMLHDCVWLTLIDMSFIEQDPDLLMSLREHDPSSYIVILSDEFDMQMMLDGLQQGAMSYVAKEISSERLVCTLRLVATGAPVLPPQLIDALQARSRRSESDASVPPIDAASLSDREFQILRWLIVGHPNKVISQRMDISEATVKVHVKSVLRKLNVQNRTQAAMWAANHGVREHGGKSGRVAGARESSSPQLPMFRTSGR